MAARCISSVATASHPVAIEVCRAPLKYVPTVSPWKGDVGRSISGIWRPRARVTGSALVGARTKRQPCTTFNAMSMGFSSSNNVSVERSVDGHLKSAAKLLLFQDVMLGETAQAFLRLLLALRLGDGVKALDAYGTFFKMLLHSGHSSWEDYVLDGILRGANNPFAAAAMAGVIDPDGSSSPATVARLNPVLVYSAESDLQILQHLCVAQSTLVDWVVEVARLPEDDPWIAAAAKPLTSNGRANPSSAGGAASPSDPATSADASDSAGATEEAAPSDVLLVQSPKERTELAARIGAYWSWSKAVEDLCLFYYQHGTGDLSKASVFTWQPAKTAEEGRLVAVGVTRNKAPTPTRVRPRHPRLDTRMLFPDVRRELEETLEMLLLGDNCPHVLLSGPRGSGKTWLLQEVTSEAFAKGLRVVQLPRKDIRLLTSLGKSLAKFPRARFLVLLEDIALETVNEDYLALKSALDAPFSVPWPANAIVCATTTDHAEITGEARALFGSDLALDNRFLQQLTPEGTLEYLPPGSSVRARGQPPAPMDRPFAESKCRNLRDVGRYFGAYLQVT
eukprot:jgi/Mesvir1/22577/Mv21221-RA.1